MIVVCHTQKPEPLNLNRNRLYKEILLNDEELKQSSIEVYVEYTEGETKHHLVREVKF
ncbi:MAG: hypothetical protein H7A25_26510 [Leptospiraceae bacterium]|nr:hypothetical protein [Leptospiraceae bacterium]MCP5503480.1 hypothetical protein [Leptospiraceae bacterium]